MNGSRPFLVLTLTHVSPLTWYHLLGHSLFREEHVIWAQILSMNSLGAMTGLEMGVSPSWSHKETGGRDRGTTCRWEDQACITGRQSSQGSTEAGAVSASPLPSLCPSGTQVYGPEVNQCRVSFLLLTATIPKFTLHVWRKLIGRTWLLQTAFKGQSVLLWRRRHFQWLQGNFLDVNLISLPG